MTWVELEIEVDAPIDVGTPVKVCCSSSTMPAEFLVQVVDALGLVADVRCPLLNGPLSHP